MNGYTWLYEGMDGYRWIWIWIHRYGWIWMVDIHKYGKIWMARCMWIDSYGQIQMDTDGYGQILYRWIWIDTDDIDGFGQIWMGMEWIDRLIQINMDRQIRILMDMARYGCQIWRIQMHMDRNIWINKYR